MRVVKTVYHNLPKRFIDRHTTFLVTRKERLPQYQQKIFSYKRKPYYDQWRPWEDQFKTLNRQGVRTTEIFVEPIRDWPYFRGDRVEVLKGPDKGKQGAINYIVKERNWVFVAGLNLRRDYMGRGKTSLGLMTCKEDPYLVNHEVKLVDPSDLMPTDVEWRYDDNGQSVRVSTRTERVIPIPDQAHETIDYVDKSQYKEGPKDTLPSDVIKKTFVPQSKTFEMDICDRMGIEDHRIPYPMYWY